MIKEIIFFNDYSLFAQCEVEAKKADVKINLFIVGIVEEILERKYCIKKDHKKSIDFWISCQQAAQTANMPIAGFIEDACREYFKAPEPQKVSIFQRISRAMSLPTGPG